MREKAFGKEAVDKLDKRLYPKTKKCLKCKGKGIVKRRASIDCPKCSGLGVILIEDKRRSGSSSRSIGLSTGEISSAADRPKEKPCSKCARRGKVWGMKEEECPTCNGTGVVF